MGNIMLHCTECGDSFLFSEGEQIFYKRNNLNIPKRCKKCRDNSLGVNLGVKTSSYFQNAEVYGPGVSVEGGLSIEYIYYIENEQNEFLTSEDGRAFFVKDKNAATFFRIRSDAERIVKHLMEEKNVQCRVMAMSMYNHLR